ncbi:hypothetical protein B0T14DRAFT_310012 [Immersiella caudata]|uniref:Uncharacterized protein n=1 Tax=Immersiella caudata TaxID=314043 RepID=A0AA39WFN1_9PEZI|nr:hypothetical protein B0T14DRAFT_310012 [Immersiella caudata]
MGLCESYVDADAQEQNKKNLEIGGILGLQDLEWLRSWHIEPISSLDKSKAIYAAYDSTNWLHKSCEELISIGKQYLVLVKHLESHYHISIPQDAVQHAVHRAGLDRHMLVYLERMLRSQFDSYNNFLARQESKYSARIAEASYNDSLSMKTISYLTMVFFPSRLSRQSSRQQSSTFSSGTRQQPAAGSSHRGGGCLFSAAVW